LDIFADLSDGFFKNIFNGFLGIFNVLLA
jgi:hypothetical protein